MARYALNRAGTVPFTVRDEDGVAVAPTAAPTVSVTNAAGTEVATGTATAGSGTGVYSYALPAGVRGALGVYEVTFAYTVAGVSQSVTEAVEVVADHLFRVDEIRSKYPDLTDATRYTAAEIRAARDVATERLERAAEVAFATRRVTVVLDGDDTTRLVLPHVEITALVSVDLYGSTTGADTVTDAFDATELADVEIDREAGVLVRTSGLWPRGNRNIAVTYEHGYERPPTPVRDAGMRLALESLLPNSLPTRALSQSTDVGDFRISVANPEAGRPTGDPEIDAVIIDFGRRRPTVG